MNWVVLLQRLLVRQEVYQHWCMVLLLQHIPQYTLLFSLRCQLQLPPLDIHEFLTSRSSATMSHSSWAINPGVASVVYLSCPSRNNLASSSSIQVFMISCCVFSTVWCSSVAASEHVSLWRHKWRNHHQHYVTRVACRLNCNYCRCDVPHGCVSCLTAIKSFRVRRSQVNLESDSHCSARRSHFLRHWLSVSATAM